MTGSLLVPAAAALTRAGQATVTAAAVLAGLLGSVVFALVSGARALQSSTGQGLPETRLHRYDAQALEAYLKAAGPGGRNLYRHELAIDYGYLVVYGTSLAVTAFMTWGLVLEPTHDGWRWAALALPILASLVDAVEDSLLRRAVRPGDADSPLAHPEVVATANVVSKVKLVLVALAIGVALGGLFTLAFAGPHRI